MWTDTTRAQHARSGLRLPTDLTDAEWLVLEPVMPEAMALGRPRKWGWRTLLDAMLYLLRRSPVAHAPTWAVSARIHCPEVVLSLAGQRFMAFNQPCTGDAGA